MNTSADRPRWRFTIAHRFTPRFQAGVEINPGVGEIRPIANWIAQAETDTRPMISLGTSSDRIFSPEGNQAYFATFAKSVPAWKAAPYFSVFYSEWEDRLIFPFGANVSLSEQLDFLPMNDGRNTHLLLNVKRDRDNFTLMLIKMRHLGLSYGLGF